MAGIKVALCIPTYNRSEIVKEFIENCADYYIQAGIDVFYLDSSTDDKTEEYIQSRLDDVHLFYRRIPSETRMDEKALMIFQEYGLKKEYDFIWLCGDGIQYPPKGVEAILSSLNVNTDLAVIDYTNRDISFHAEEIHTAQMFFSKCALPMILYGSTLLNARTMLKNVNWNAYAEKCLKRQYDTFAHVMFYWNRMLELPIFNGLCLTIGEKEMRMSPSPKKQGTTYYHKLFSVWFEKWPAVIDSLPSVYENKEALLSQGPGTLFSQRSNMWRMRQDGVLTWKQVIQHRRTWKMISPIPCFDAFCISVVPSKVVKLCYEYRLHQATKEINRLKQKSSHFYILGVGKIGNQVGQFLNNCDINYDAFCTMEEVSKENKLLGHDILLYNNIYSKPNVRFLLAMGPRDAKKTIEILNCKKYCGEIYYNPTFIRDVAFALGYRAFHR